MAREFFVDIDLDSAALKEDLHRLRRDLEGKALARSLSHTARKGRTFVDRRVRSELNVKQKHVRKNLRVLPARGGEAGISVEPERMPLGRFAPRQRKAGASVKVKRRGARKVVKKAFVVKFKSGHVGVFYRAKPSQRTSRSSLGKRQLGPERLTTALVQLLDDQVELSAIGEHMNDVFVRELARQVDLLEVR